jgi:hypothetical protein
MRTLWRTPAPSTSFIEGVSFKVLSKRVCTLSFDYENLEGVLVSGEARFVDVAAFKCTYLPSLTAEMIESAYDRLVDVGCSQWLEEARAVAEYKGATSPLRHLRVCFDDGPCYEFVCCSFELAQ